MNATSYPLLKALGARLGQSLGKPLANRRIIVSGPHLLEDLPAYLTELERLGLNPRTTLLFYKPYPYPQAEELQRAIRARGYQLHSIKSVDQVLTARQSTEPMFVIEDGGHVASFVYTHPGIPVSGFVEQTTRGLRVHEDQLRLRGRLPAPVLTVADAEIKSRFEPPLIADQIVHNLRILAPRLPIRGSRILVVGAGTIGLPLARRLRENGASLRLVDPRPLRRLEVIADCGPDALALSIDAAAPWADLVIGATGTRSIPGNVLQRLKSGAMVASISSDQVEIEIPWLNRNSVQVQEWFWQGQDKSKPAAQSIYTLHNGRRIVLLNSGYPLNFSGPHAGMAPNGGDLVMSLMIAASVGLVQHLAGPNAGSGILRGELDRLVAKFGILEDYLRLYHSV
jgi:S-adenosylhomocysteine hydrolase